MKKSIFCGIALVLCGLVTSPAFAQIKKESQVRGTAAVETTPTKDNATSTQTKDETGTQTKDETVKPTKGNSTVVLQGRPKSKPKQVGTVKPSNDTPKQQTTNVLQPKPKTTTNSNGNVGVNPRSNSGNNGVILVPNNDPKNQPKPTTQENDEHGGGKSKCGVPGCTRPGRHEGFHKHEGHHHGEGEDHDDHDNKGKGKGKGHGHDDHDNKGKGKDKGHGHDDHDNKGKGKNKNDD